MKMITGIEAIFMAEKAKKKGRFWNKKRDANAVPYIPGQLYQGITELKRKE